MKNFWGSSTGKVVIAATAIIVVLAVMALTLGSWFGLVFIGLLVISACLAFAYLMSKQNPQPARQAPSEWAETAQKMRQGISRAFISAASALPIGVLTNTAVFRTASPRDGMPGRVQLSILTVNAASRNMSFPDARIIRDVIQSYLDDYGFSWIKADFPESHGAKLVMVFTPV